APPAEQRPLAGPAPNAGSNGTDGSPGIGRRTRVGGEQAADPAAAARAVGPVVAGLRDARRWQPRWLATRTPADSAPPPPDSASAPPGATPRPPGAAAQPRAARIQAAAGALARHWPGTPDPDEEPIPLAAAALVDASSRGRSRGARHTHAANAIRPFW